MTWAGWVWATPKRFRVHSARQSMPGRKRTSQVRLSPAAISWRNAATRSAQIDLVGPLQVEWSVEPNDQRDQIAIFRGRLNLVPAPHVQGRAFAPQVIGTFGVGVVSVRFSCFIQRAYEAIRNDSRQVGHHLIQLDWIIHQEMVNVLVLDSVVHGNLVPRSGGRYVVGLSGLNRCESYSGSWCPGQDSNLQGLAANGF